MDLKMSTLNIRLAGIDAPEVLSVKAPAFVLILKKIIS